MSVAHVGKYEEPQSNWLKHIKAIRNVPPLFRMVWEATPGVVASSISLRLVAASLPLAILIVTKKIIDSIVNHTSHHIALPKMFWWLVALEFGLASLAMISARVIDFCDGLLADKFTHYITIRIMKHASSLDLISFEDPLFYDKLERARVQGTDRIGMIQASGRLVQETITTSHLAASIYVFSPWILFVLIVCIVPTFLVETRFAFLGYSLSSRQTPARREMEYFRVLGGSKESAKELKLFGLKFVPGRSIYQALRGTLRGNGHTVPTPVVCRGVFCAAWDHWVLRFLRIRNSSNRDRRADSRNVDFARRSDRRAQAPIFRQSCPRFRASPVRLSS